MKRRGGFKKGDKGGGKRPGQPRRGSGFGRTTKKAGSGKQGGFAGGVYYGRKEGDGRGGSRGRKGEGVRITGKLIGNARGFGFVKPDREGMEDVFIPPSYMGSALHGDRVEVVTHAEGRGGRAWGEIAKVIERSDAPVVGYFNGQMVAPRDPRFSAWVRVEPADAGGAAAGEMVMAEIVKTGPRGVVGRIIEVLGSSNEPGIESRLALRSHGFEEEFSAEAMEEAEAAPPQVTAAQAQGREDLRGLFTITIDPETARDFDDAVAIERAGSGYRLWVSIADVSHYVKSGSAIDAEAYERATSVYFPDRAIPMLPPELSSGICSLRPGQDRLAMTVEMELDGQGKRLSARMYASVIKSDHRLTYEQVERMEHEHDLRREFSGAWPAIEIMRELSELRRRRRISRGAIDLDMPEPQIILDEAGEVTDIRRSEQTWSHRLIEEFMLLANETVAAFLTDHDQPMIYRIHEPPAPSSVLALADVLAPLGLKLLLKDSSPEHVRPRDFQRVITKASGTPYETMVKYLCLRSMMQAVYSAELRGHFGLAAERYCHFTSPIRRYPDLMVHRILKLFLGTAEKEGAGYKPVSRNLARDLKQAAEHCSERERASMEAEREMTDLYRARWMAKRLGEEFEGMISSVTAFGLFVELREVFVEGLIPADTLDRDLEFHEKLMLVRGRSSGIEFRIGDRVRVQSTGVDLAQRKISFRLLEKK